MMGVKIRSLLLLLALSAGSLFPSPPAYAAPNLELYGTFQAMGVIATVDAIPGPNASANVTYRLSGSGSYRQGFQLSRVADTRFVGSLFWLQPGTLYDVRVTFSDPGGALDGFVIETTASTRAEISVPTPSLSYYVSPGGSGTTCSLASPCALTYALDQAQPGQAVVLREGTYYQGGLTLSHSGTAGAPIVIRSYPGETATLDGANPGPFTWTAQGSGVYRTTVTDPDPHLVMSNGQRLYPYGSLADLQSLSWGIAGFYASGTALYVRLAGNASPGSTSMLVSRYNNAFTVEDKNFIYFVNLTFAHYGLGSYAKALYFYNASDNLVQGCTFAVNDLGIGLKYDSQRNVIQDNTFYDTDFSWPWDAVKAGSELETGGIRMYDPMTGRGTIIRRNTFHDYFDGFGACPDSDPGATNETDVYGNLVYNTGDDGMETDGTCSNVRIWSNTFHDVLVGISLAPVYTGPVYALRNLIYRTGAGNSNYPGSAFKFNSDYGQSGPMYLIHNTADAALPGNSGLDIKSPGTWTLIYARNNIWAGTEYALSNANPSQTPNLDLDYDDLYTTQANELVWWEEASGHHLRTLAALQSVTGKELHGKSVVPGFAGAAGGDYTLECTSQLIDAGQVIPGINDDYAGAGPDIGAFEYQGGRFSLDAAPSRRTALPGSVVTYTLGVQPVACFSGTVTLVAASPSPSLSVYLDPAALTPPGQATLSVTDTHPGPTLLPGVWYTIPITASGGSITQNAGVKLLVGGARIHLPILFKK